MSFFQSIKSGMFDFSLKRKLKQRRSIPSKAVNLENAKKIGLLFDATEADQRKIALDFAEKWQKQKKQFRLLGFFNSKLKNENFTFDHYNLKDVNWFGAPAGETVNKFLAEDFDLLIHLSTHPNLQMEYISLLAVAPLKIGPPPASISGYDLMFEVAASSGLKQFIQQMEIFLQKINTSPSHA